MTKSFRWQGFSLIAKSIVEDGIHYRIEIELVSRWIEILPQIDLLPAAIPEKLHLVLDTGYDATSTQNAVSEINAKFHRIN